VHTDANRVAPGPATGRPIRAWQTLFTALFPDPSVGYIDLRALPVTRQAFLRPGDRLGIHRFLTQHADQDLYFGVAARQDPSNGTLENCTQLWALFVDIDFKTSTAAEARQRLDEFPLPPSIVVESGGGLHPYWWLQQPVEVPQERDRIYRALRSLARAVGGDPAAAEPARILRIPGTWNRKYTPARPVRLIAFHPERRYRLDELPDEPDAQARPESPPFTVPETIPDGTRNTQLYKFGRALKAKGLDRTEIRIALQTANQLRCVPPLDAATLQMIEASVWFGRDRPDFAARGNGAAPETWQPVMVQLSTVEAREVEWLWRHRIAMGKLNLLVGDPDVGKSYLACDIASRVSTGRIWPDGTDCPDGDVILLAAEDALDDTTRPRIDRLGGDPRRISALTMMRWGDRERMFSLVDDLAVLEHKIQARHARLVVIDVLNAYLGTARRPIDSYRDSDIRGVLAPLAKMAERQRVALLATMHLTKNTERRALYRVLGSIGYVGQARMVLSASLDPRDPDQQRRLLAGIKGNIARKAPTLAFSITDDGLSWEPDQVQGMNAEQALGNLSPDEHSARQTAREFLRARLHAMPAGTEVEVNVIVEEARQQGIAMRTLQHARNDVGARVRRDGPSGKWFWSLPIRRFVMTHEEAEDERKAPEGDGLGKMPPEAGTLASWQVAPISTEENADTAELSGQLANLPTRPLQGQSAKLLPAVRRQYEDAVARLRRRMQTGLRP
jgi:hypothetical protein